MIICFIKYLIPGCHLYSIVKLLGSDEPARPASRCVRPRRFNICRGNQFGKSQTLRPPIF